MLILVAVLFLDWLSSSLQSSSLQPYRKNHIKIRPVAPPRLVLSQDGVLLAENRPSFACTGAREGGRSR